MEFGSLGLGTQSQTTVVQSSAASAPQSATLSTNPEYVVTSSAQTGRPENELRRENGGRRAERDASTESANQAPDEFKPTSRRTTLNFDSEQNRVFLEVIDTVTEKVIERIPSETLVALIKETVNPLPDPGGQDTSNIERADTSI